METTQQENDTSSIKTGYSEILFQEIESNYFKNISELKQLSKKVQNLHATILYHKDNSKIGKLCQEAWEIIILCFTGKDDWKDLGYNLGIPNHKLNFIAHAYEKSKWTDTVLRVYMQDPSATLEKVLETFNKMKRYDILSQLQKPLLDLVEIYIRDENNDTGYISKESDGLYTVKNIPNTLPEVLKSDSALIVSEQLNSLEIFKTNDEGDRHNPILPSENILLNEIEINDDDQILLLTFSRDGLEAAYNLKNRLNSWREDFPNLKVITLNDNRNEVLVNPERFIMKYFEKALFVLPVITNGYLKEVESGTPDSFTEHLDCKYVHFIHNLIFNNYISSRCMNRKVRSILPDDCSNPNLLGQLIMKLMRYPKLNPWICDSNLDEQFKVILSAKIAEVNKNA